MVSAGDVGGWGKFKFRGPILFPGPDWGEPISRFRLEFLERECRHDPRVRRWLDEQPERLAARVARLERELSTLKAHQKGPQPQKGSARPHAQPKPTYQGVVV